MNSFSRDVRDVRRTIFARQNGNELLTNLDAIHHWKREMRFRGHYVEEVNAYTINHWEEIHRWLIDNIGLDNYSHLGHVFAFSSEDAAFKFKMFCK